MQPIRMPRDNGVDLAFRYGLKHRQIARARFTLAERRTVVVAEHVDNTPAASFTQLASVGFLTLYSERLSVRVGRDPDVDAGKGSDIAAILRVRGSPVVVRPPPAGLRLVEEVRTGLRRSVADRRPEPRALVPALVLGDTSGLDTALTENFTSTSLTHVTI